MVEASDRWALPRPPDAGVDVVLWGRHARNIRPSASGIPFAVRREAALGRLRAQPPRGLRLAELHRLVPVSRPGRLRRPIRNVLLGGALAELVRGERPTRVIDAVAVDGSALARLDLDTRTQAELRVAKVGHTKDPARGRAALLALAAADVPLVPRPLGGGITAGAAWATESVMVGQHVDTLTPALLDQITRFLAALPAGPVDRRAVDDQLAEVAEVFPEHAAAFERAAAAAVRWGASLPAVLVHGDMWLNNVFITDGQLSGVFDWDTWHPAGLPGTDLLNLLAADARTRQRRDIGELLAADYWRSPDVVDALHAYARARNLPAPDDAGLAAIAIGWWVSRVAGSLHRAHRAIDDPAWVRRNIDLALERLERLERELG
jgi:hypothetical protein